MSVSIKDNLGSLGFASAKLTLGVHEEEGARVHPNAEDGETIAEIAQDHEEGLGVPRRSWLRSFTSANEAKITEKLRELATGSEDVDDLTKALQDHVLAGDIPPPNSPATIAKKGHGRTLFETGTMIEAMRAKVTKQ